VERIWRGQTGPAGTFISIASSHWEAVVWEDHGETHISVRGPETQATVVPVPENSASFGVIFTLGTVMPHLPVPKLVDNSIVLPKAGGRSFWLKGRAWEFPTFENVDTFIDRLVREALLDTEPLVENSLNGLPHDLSMRTAYRRFLKATGLTKGAVHQIERARHATMLLQDGMSILDTIEAAGYYDQPHLTRSLKRYVGQTPAMLLDKEKAETMSFLYKTLSLW
jgi:hypothetical protein